METEKFEILQYPYLFIIGSPRSGTTWLQNILKTHPQIASNQNIELTLFDQYIAPLTSRWYFEKNKINQGIWVQGLPTVWSQEEFDNFLKQFISGVYQVLLDKKPQAKVILDKYPHNTNQTGLIRYFLPNARFLHIIRDGRDSALSMISASKRKGFGKNNIVDAAKEWKLCVNKAREFGKSHPEQYCEIRYEDLLNNKTQILKQVFNFAGVDSSDQIINDILKDPVIEEKVSFPRLDKKSQKSDWSEKMSLSERYAFQHFAGDTLIELNYEQSPHWWKINFGDQQKIMLLKTHIKFSRISGALSRALKAPSYG